MHIVDITLFYSPRGGGVRTYLAEKAGWLAGAGIKHTIASPGIAAAQRRPGLLPLAGWPIPGIADFRMPRSIAGPARQLHLAQPDLIEVGDGYHCAWAALRVRRRDATPVVAFCHSDLSQLLARRFGRLTARAGERYLANLYRRCDLVLAPSRLMAQRLEAIGVPGVNWQPLGVNARTFRPQRREPALRQALGLPEETRLLVYAGRFTPEKKLDTLLAASARLGRPYHLVLIGQGSRARLAPHVTVVGFQSDPRRLAAWLASCDVLVHPGDCETFGLIVLEAMACGLPVVGTRAGAVAELVDAQTGVLVQADCVPSLCEGIEAIFQMNRSQLALNARRKVVAEYDWNRIFPQLLGRYASLLALPQRRQLQAGIRYAPG